MTTPLNATEIRERFPMYGERPLSYLDSASSSLTPLDTLWAMDEYYSCYRANVHRGMYAASLEATQAYDRARKRVAEFIGARESEIVFTRGATESINLLAHSLGMKLGRGDEVLLSAFEHHANLVPWQQMAQQRGFVLKFIPLRADYTLDMDAAKALIGPQTRVVSIAHASNVTGTILPIKDIATLAHRYGAVLVVDAAQTVGRMPVHVKSLDCDFLVFSGHKCYGPTGIGVLFGKKAMLEALDPYMFGGDMILEVYRDRSTWAESPQKFEAGTPNIAGAIGLGAAIDFMDAVGLDAIRDHEVELSEYCVATLSAIPGVKLFTPADAAQRVGVVSFTVDGVHPHDVATILDGKNVCVRGGTHCAMPLLRDLGVPATARASFGVYSAKEDVDALANGIIAAKRMFHV